MARGDDLYVSVGVQSRSLDKLLRGLREYPEKVQEAQERFEAAVARDIVARAITLAKSEGSTAAKSATDITVRRRATISYGGHAYDFGAEFGAITYHQFQTWRGNDDRAGYFLWPTVRGYESTELLQKWDDIVGSAIDECFN